MSSRHAPRAGGPPGAPAPALPRFCPSGILAAHPGVTLEIFRFHLGTQARGPTGICAFPRVTEISKGPWSDRALLQSWLVSRPPA